MSHRAMSIPVTLELSQDALATMVLHYLCDNHVIEDVTGSVFMRISVKDAIVYKENYKIIISIAHPEDGQAPYPEDVDTFHALEIDTLGNVMLYEKRKESELGES